MHRAWAVIGLGAAVGALGVLPVDVWASTLDGTPIQSSGLNDFFSTVWGYMNGPAGKVGGAFLCYSGLTKMGSGREGNGAYSSLGAGAGMCFVPNIITTFFAAAPAATGSILAQSAAWLTQVVQGFQGGQFLQDPVFWLPLLMTALILATVRPRPVAAH